MSDDLHRRANALAGELIGLKREAALAGDDGLNVRLKEASRVLRHRDGQVFSESAYTRLRETVADELYGKVDSEEQAIVARKESLIATVRQGVERELAGERAGLEAQASALEYRELDVAARERKAQPSYRAAFFTAGAFLTLSADVLLRVVA